MFELLHARFSIFARLALIGALFLAPIGVLVYLFVQQSMSDISFAQSEIQGTRYIAEVWPGFYKTAATNAVAKSDIPDRAAFDAQFGTGEASATFVDAKDVAAKLSAGKNFIGSIADKSNLTLDPDLDSFYAMDAATVRIPGIVDATAALSRAIAEPAGSPGRIVDIAFAVDHLRQSSDDAQSSLGTAMKNNAPGLTSKALASATGALKAATDLMSDQGKALLEGGEAKDFETAQKNLLAAVDGVWEPTNNEVARLLEARIDGFTSKLIRSLVFSAVFTLAAISLSVLMARGLSARLSRLIGVMDRLVANDASVEVPYLKDGNETGRIAKSLSAFREAVVERSALKSEKAIIEELAAEREANVRAKAEIAARQAIVVEKIADCLGQLANADLTVSIRDEFPEEFERLRKDLNLAARQLRAAMETIGATTTSIHTGAEQLTHAVDNLQGRTEQQAASLEETAAALDEITATVKNSADSAGHARSIVSAANDDAKKTTVVVREAVEAMGGIAASARQISQIIGVIDEIAFQTNLLALNAGVEAARAGEAGRGFAVVASEVRALAQRSADAAKEIKALISSSTTQVDLGVKLVAETGKSLEKIMAQVAEINGVVSDMANGANEQATGLQEVNIAINQMDQVTQQNAAMVEESTAACHHLAQEAKELSKLVGQFQISAANDDHASLRAMARAAETARSDAKAGAARRPAASTYRAAS